jgi:pyruvate formate lyase activating enzyme
MENVDLVLYDLKHMDTAMHQMFTGVLNGVILRNLAAILQETNAVVWVRIPVIPAFNNSEETIVAMAALLSSLPRPIEKVSLLPFHQYGAGKYPALGRPYPWFDQVPDPEERIENLKHCLETFNLNVEIGR